MFKYFAVKKKSFFDRDFSLIFKADGMNFFQRSQAS